MHGRLKVRTSEEERILKEKERAKKVIKYKAAMAMIFEKRTNSVNDKDTLVMIAEILSNNPDVSVLWNYRREILLFLSKSEPIDEVNKLYDSELYLTEVCLKKNPKSYPTWYQRIWVLESRTEPNWTKELNLCNMYLKLDERNFHCWDYRRHVVSKLGTEDKNEFKFTNDKIMENFSNYSAWHYRSKLLTKLYPDPFGVRSIEEVRHRDELELVLNAAFTDPNDTSAWFYQRWLLGAMPQTEKCSVIRVTPTMSFISFNQPVGEPSRIVRIVVDDKDMVGTWQSLSGYKKDILWILNHNCDVIIQPDLICKVYSKEDEKETGLVCNYVDGEFIAFIQASFSNKFGSSVLEELQKQVESCEQLLELEPDSKWTHLTLTVIKHSIDHIENYNSCISILYKLIELDPKRKNYYKDLASRWHLEYILQQDLDCSKRGQFQKDESCVKLSTLYHLQYWSACAKVYLNDNQLTSQCLPKLYVLQNCEILHLENNCITSLKGFPLLPKLKAIYLKGNNVEDASALSVCPLLKEIILD